MKARISNSDWQDLFEALTGQSNFKVTIEEKSKGLLLKTKDESLPEKLQKIFFSAENIQSQLKFVLKKPGQQVPLEVKKFERTGAIVNGYNIFKRLLQYCGQKQLTSLVFDWDSETADYLFEDLSKATELLPLRKKTIEVFSLTLKKLTYAQLRAVLPMGEFKPSRVELESKTDGPLASIIEKILFLDSQKQTIFFDYNLFISCFSCPQAQIQLNSTDAEWEIRFPSAVQLLNYLRTSLDSSFIIKASSDGEEKIGHLIILGEASTTASDISRPNHFYYALDCSESMNWCNNETRDFDKTLFPQVLQTSTGIASKINEFATPSTLLSIYPIKGPRSPVAYEDFKIQDEKRLQNCKEFLNLLEAKSGTNLYGTLLAIFNRINLHPEMNNCVMIITDGDDQNEPLVRQKLYRQLTEICLTYKTSTPPQVFIVTIGRNVAEELTYQLSLAIKATIINVEKHEDIAELYNYFREMHLPMKLVDILVKMQDVVTTQERVPVYSGHPRSLRSMLVKEGQTVSFGGSSYVVSHKSLPKKLSDMPDSVWSEARRTTPSKDIGVKNSERLRSNSF